MGPGCFADLLPELDSLAVRGAHHFDRNERHAALLRRAVRVEGSPITSSYGNCRRSRRDLAMAKKNGPGV